MTKTLQKKFVVTAMAAITVLLLLLLVLIGVGSWEVFRIFRQLFHHQRVTLVPRPATEYECPNQLRGKRERRR